ncbi:hypothetical protein [Allonocardiopsis opalescens]|uniref:Uncharacterized protein n=1 Tax=Allonocardiopsis opalescens TaxID=1144618 RepID=A0A2T0PU88_9ACTN|nr:hypothetical protein [Allonocardiopsis opalescens]PRX92472.1 hypothetical protein CLV72_110233 [Allonocardiopsis opalescens]
MITEKAVETVRGWFGERLPAEWFAGAPEVVVDREEITVVGTLAEPETPDGAEAPAARVRAFRERTRERRIEIALEAEETFGRKVSWGAGAGEHREMFTTLSVPMMTRLRQPERQVLDTLVEAGVARSRSHALAWCVRLVGSNADEWLGELRTALGEVGRVRAEGPDV